MIELIFDDDSQKELKEWIESKTGSNYSNDKYIGTANNGIITACCAYEVYGDTTFAHIAVEALIPKCFLNVIFDYPFNQLKLERIIALVEKDNQKASRLVEHMGFSLIDQDQVKVYEMKKEQCRFITP